MAKNTIAKDAIILCVITVIAGFGLGAVHDITLEPIAQADYEKQQTAYKTVFPDASSFEDLEGFDTAEASKCLAGYTTSDDQDLSEDTIDSCVTALDDSGNVLGYVINATDPNSYGGDVTLSLGVQLDGTVNGYSITVINDTAGLGQKAKDDSYSSQYAGKKLEGEDLFTVTKTGSTSDSEIDAISGATISSRAVTRAVDSALVYFRTISEGGAAE